MKTLLYILARSQFLSKYHYYAIDLYPCKLASANVWSTNLFVVSAKPHSTIFYHFGLPIQYQNILLKIFKVTIKKKIISTFLAFFANYATMYRYITLIMIEYVNIFVIWSHYIVIAGKWRKFKCLNVSKNKLYRILRLRFGCTNKISIVQRPHITIILYIYIFFYFHLLCITLNIQHDIDFPGFVIFPTTTPLLSRTHHPSFYRALGYITINVFVVI